MKLVNKKQIDQERNIFLYKYRNKRDLNWFQTIKILFELISVTKM